MTTAPERPMKKRVGRTGYGDRPPRPPSLIEWLNEMSTICGTCFGHRTVWCPCCAGFGGCWTCNGREKVRCPQCAGGRLDGWHW